MPVPGRAWWVEGWRPVVTRTSAHRERCDRPAVFSLYWAMTGTVPLGREGSSVHRWERRQPASRLAGRTFLALLGHVVHQHGPGRLEAGLFDHELVQSHR